MSATTISAKHKSTGRINHINDVDVRYQQDFGSLSCGKDIIVVKSKPRKKNWHFRLTPDKECIGARDTVLHQYAVQLLIENDSIYLAKSIIIQHSDPKEAL